MNKSLSKKIPEKGYLHASSLPLKIKIKLINQKKKIFKRKNFYYRVSPTDLDGKAYLKKISIFCVKKFVKMKGVLRSLGKQ